MGQKSSFVFLSQFRWRKVKLLLVGLLISTSLFIIAAAAGLTQSFNQNFSWGNARPIIDEISTRVEDKIELSQEGPVISLKSDNGHFLIRENPQIEKSVFLTFDDGPDPVFTRPILDILQKEQVKATFFTIGEHLQKYPQMAKEIQERGNLIANHTFSHTPEEVDLYERKLRMYFEFELTQRYIENITGNSSKIFRIPYGGTDQTVSMNNLVLAINASLRGYKIAGSTIDSNDWQAKTSSEILESVKIQDEELKTTPVILLHDSGGSRQNTIEALPQIIAYYKQKGYKFETADKLFPNEPTVTPVTWIEKIYSASVVSLYNFFRNLPQLTSSVFIFGLLTFGIHSVLIGTFAIFHKIRENGKITKPLKYQPKVSIVIPAYNEEKVIEKTVNAALRQNYSNFEVIIVNDGSTDKTQKKLTKFIKNEKVSLLWQQNSGKFSALNTGVNQAKGKIVVVIDADTQIMPNTVLHLAKHFKDKRIGAVSGNVKVGNQNSLLAILQEIDYRTALNLERRAFDFLDSIFVVPGAVGAWRKKAVVTSGGFSPATITEDAELGLRLRKAGWKINFEPKAIGLTEVPQSLRSFTRQRFRWTFGILQTLWLHKDMNFKIRYGTLGIFTLPYIICIQLPSMALATAIEAAAIPLAIFVSAKLVIVSLATLLFGRLILFIIASILAGENFSLFAYIIPYRFFYQYIWYLTLDVAILTALKGVYVSWQKLPHFGLVEMDSKAFPIASANFNSAK